MTNLIRAAVFKKRGTPNRTLMDSLVVRGGSSMVGETLQDKFKWDGSSPIACPVFTLDTAGGSITAARWTLHGKLAKVIKFRAEDVFEQPNKDLIVAVDVADLSLFEFGGRAATSCTGWRVVTWVESGDLKFWVTNKVTKERLSGEDAVDHGIKDFCCRADL